MRLPQLERLELLESDGLKLSLAFFEGLADRYVVDPNLQRMMLRLLSIAAMLRVLVINKSGS